MMLNLELVYSGALLAYWSCLLIPIMALELSTENPKYTDKHIDSMALQALVFFGLGEVICGAIMGYVNDKVGAKKTCLVNIIIIIITTALTILNLYELEYNFLTFVVCFMWGFQDAAVNLHI